MSGTSRIGYCALEYKPQGEYQTFHDESRVVLIISAPKEGRAIVRVHPQWRSIVPASEHDYLRELFDEFRQRAEIDSEGLIDQLSTVNVGPIVTRDAGQGLQDNPALLRLFERFQDP